MMVHVVNLPPEAMTFGKWRTTDELAAQQVEMTHALLRISLAGYRIQLTRSDAAKVKIPDPYRVPRPGDEPVEVQPSKKLSRESIRRALLGG